MAREINGVFDGGGAKGVAYVGALQASERAGLRFKAVAGSSAGAITAALVACGCTAETIDTLMLGALSRLGGTGRALAHLRRRSLLSSSALHRWLRETVAEQLRLRTGRAGGGDPTFSDVREATGITLYVITMDLASRQPLVFSPDLTPSASVADAVVASSAIPVAFPSQRVLIGDTVHRLADGGVWANYPSFVFLDDDFRRCYGLGDEERNRPTVGFILDPPQAAADGPAQSRLSTVRAVSGAPLLTDHGAAARELGIVGGLITSPFARLAAVALPLLVSLLGVQWFIHELDDDFSTVSRLPDGIEYLALILLMLLFAFLVGVLFLVAFFVVRIGRALVDEGVVGASAAMGVGPNVPAWIGANPTGVDVTARCHVPVRIPVPAELTTLGFGADEGLRKRAKEAGYLATARALNAYGIGGIEDPAPSAPVAEHHVHRRLRGAFGLVASGALLLVGFWACAWLSRQVIRTAWEGRVPWWQLALLLLGGGAIVALHGMRRHQRAMATRTFLTGRSTMTLALIAVPSLAIGLFLVAYTLPGSGELTLIERITSERFEGRVMAEPTVGQPDGPFDGTVDVLSSTLAPINGFDASEHTGDCPAVAGVDCYSMRTDRGAWGDVELGSTTELRYFFGRDLVLPQSALWDYSYDDITYLTLALPFLVLAYRCWTAYRSRRQHATAPPRAGDP